jgi:hypothetical protein
MTSLLLLMFVLTASAAAPQKTDQEGKPKIPKDSIELTVTGCLKGRVLKASETRTRDVESSPYVGGKSFRLASKKAVTEDIKKHDGHLVEVTGIVKRSDLEPRGVRVGRIQVAGSHSTSPNGLPDPAENVLVMDALAVRFRATACGG